jgi:hypothetical protein
MSSNWSQYSKDIPDIWKQFLTAAIILSNRSPRLMVAV